MISKQIQKKAALIFFSLFLFVLAPVQQAFAHRVNVFAWVEGDAICSISKFSGGRPAKNADIIVFGPDKKTLLTGKTDEKGEFSFPIPKTDAGITLVLNASMGHRGEWSLSRDDIIGATMSLETPGHAHTKMPSPESPTLERLGPESLQTVPPESPHAISGASALEIKKIVDDALDRKLAPMLKLAANSSMPKTSLTDIMSGLGHIMGIVGIALYILSRRKKTGAAPDSESQTQRSAQ